VELENVKLAGAQETTLATLYGKAMESRRRNSVLQDQEAYKALQRIDYDFSRLSVRPSDQVAAAARAKAYDGWVRRFIARHPDGTVLHLGCGLDTRVYRVDPPATIGWYDIDFPDVIELRQRLFPHRDGLHTVGASITDPHLLDEIPGDRPVLVVAEGVTPYLQAADGLAMLRRITEHFPAGDMVFDGYGRRGVWFLQRYGCVRASGAQLGWAIDDPREIERAVPGLLLDEEWWYGDDPDVGRHYSGATRQLLRILFRIRAVRRLGRGLRYHFGSGHRALTAGVGPH
jgi:O-methyltransferase involved in polyketide biosynthesis